MRSEWDAFERSWRGECLWEWAKGNKKIETLSRSSAVWLGSDSTHQEGEAHWSTWNAAANFKMQWHLIIHYGMTTAHDILNIGRAINAGECTFYTDGTFNVCWNDLCLLGCREGERCDWPSTVGFSVNPSESEEAIRATKCMNVFCNAHRKYR